MIVGILGASGFVGKQLALVMRGRVAELRLASSRGDGVNYEIDLNRRTGDVDRFFDGLSIFFNCAGVNISGTDALNINSEGVKWLIEQTRKYSFRWVQLSSVGIYRRQDSGLIEVNARYGPNNLYERSKMAVDLSLMNNLDDYRIIRPSSIVGEGMTSSWGYRLINKIVENHTLFVGNSGAILNVVDVQDVARALMIAGWTDSVPQNIYIVNDPIYLSKFIDIVTAALQLETKLVRSIPFAVAVAKVIIKMPFLTRLTGVSGDAIDFLSTRRVFDGAAICKQLNFIYRGNVADSILQDYFARIKKCETSTENKNE